MVRGARKAVALNKPISVGFVMLEISKLIMYTEPGEAQDAILSAGTEAMRRGNGRHHHSDARVQPQGHAAAIAEVPHRGVTPVHGMGKLCQRRTVRYVPAL